MEIAERKSGIATIKNVSGLTKIDDEVTMSGYHKGHKVIILLDSGYQISIIGGGLFELIKNEVILYPSDLEILTVNKFEESIFGMIKEEIKINDFETEVKLKNLLKNFHQEILFGRDFIKKST